MLSWPRTPPDRRVGKNLLAEAQRVCRSLKSRASVPVKRVASGRLWPLTAFSLNRGGCEKTGVATITLVPLCLRTSREIRGFEHRQASAIVARESDRKASMASGYKSVEGCLHPCRQRKFRTSAFPLWHSAKPTVWNGRVAGHWVRRLTGVPPSGPPGRKGANGAKVHRALLPTEADTTCYTFPGVSPWKWYGEPLHLEGIR